MGISNAVWCSAIHLQYNSKITVFAFLSGYYGQIEVTHISNSAGMMSPDLGIARRKPIMKIPSQLSISIMPNRESEQPL